MRADQGDLTIAALDRTLRLMRDELGSAPTNQDLLDGLMGTEVAIVADEVNLKSHACQTAFITAALLMARSGHSVYLVAPDVPLSGPQPPLDQGTLLTALTGVGRDLVPGVEFRTGPPAHLVDAAVLLGNSEWNGSAGFVLRAGGTAWCGWTLPGDQEVVSEWPVDGWPIGGLAAATLVASEAFKIAMRKLSGFALRPEIFAALFALTSKGWFELGSEGTPRRARLGAFDIVSGGAIAQAALYTFARIPEAIARIRVIEPDINELSNLNRNMLLRRSQLGSSKAANIARQDLGSISVSPVETRYERSSDHKPGKLMPVVLVGVDHIPTRWAVQHSRPIWLTVGATSHFLAMCSFHTPELPCAGCLHPRDDPSNDPIPSVAFVSYAAGLMMGARHLYRLGTGRLPSDEQQFLFWPLRPEKPWRSVVAPRIDCPVKCSSSKRCA